MHFTQNNMTLDKVGESLQAHSMFTKLAIQLAATLSQVNTEPNTQAYWAMREVLPVAAEDESKLRRLWLRAMDTEICPKEAGRIVRQQFTGEKRLYVSLLERLCVVARAKGTVTKAEKQFLHQLGRGLRLAPWTVLHVIHRYAEENDPYAVLGIDAQMSAEKLRAYYRRAVRVLHPDHYAEYGASARTVDYLTDRLARVNAAYATIARGQQARAV